MITFPFSFLSSQTTYDPDAAAFIAAAAPLSTAEANAINQLVIDLKAESLWTVFDAIYPVVGGTAAQHKWNLKDPRNLDAAYRLTFVGSWSHTDSGMKANTGGTTYARTYLNPDTVLGTTSNSQVAYYTAPGTTTDFTHGCSDGILGGSEFALNLNAVASRNDSATASPTLANITYGSLLIGTRSSNTSLKIKRAADYTAFATVGTNTDSGGTLPSVEYFISSLNSDGTPVGVMDARIGFFAIGNGLGDSQSSTLAGIIKDYETALGRAYQDIDPDAQAFITAAGITNSTEISAISTLVNDLKSYSLWSKMNAIYPMVGGTSTSCKYNLKDPRDLDAAFRLSFSGGWTFSSNGAEPNGTNANANTYFNPATHLSDTSTSMSYYSRTNSADEGAEIGCQPNDGKRWLLLLKYHVPPYVLESQLNDTGNGNLGYAMNTTSTAAYFVASRTSSTSHKVYRSNGILATNTASMTTPNPSANCTFGSFEGLYTNRECAFSHIGSGLNDTEASNLYVSVQTFNTTLGRNV
jgi:hypothetical protein